MGPLPGRRVYAHRFALVFLMTFAAHTFVQGESIGLGRLLQQSLAFQAAAYNVAAQSTGDIALIQSRINCTPSV